MFVTIPEELVSAMRSASLGPRGTLQGQTLDDGDVAQITGLGPPDAPYGIGHWAPGDSPPEGLAEGELVALVAGEDAVRFYHVVQGEWQPVEYDVVRLHADFKSRLQGILDTDLLAAKTVAIIGLGTGGSRVAVELAQCGVGRFRLVDFDRLEAHNVARHVCGLRDLGRLKTRALRDALLNIRPGVTVETHEFNVLQDRERLAEVVRGCDLVVGATDSEASKAAINVQCWAEGIPAVYGAAYNRAFGGDVVRVLPPDSGCYQCFLSQVTELFQEAPKQSEIDYDSLADATQFRAEPGLGLDVGFVALILSKMALLTLLRGSDSTLPDLPGNFVIWGNRAEWIFERPLESLILDISPLETCPVCHAEGYAQQALGMSQAQATEAAVELLAELDRQGTVSLAGLRSRPPVAGVAAT